VAGICEYGNEPSDRINCGEFLGYLRTSSILKKDPTALSKKVRK